MPKLINIVGIRFHRLLVLKQIHGSRKCPPKIICQCDCGNITTQFKSNVTSGKVKSCSCHKNQVAKENHTKHGLTKTRTYNTWASMLQRCYNPKNKSFHNYGGRGIKVCDSWQNSFEQFYADVGERPTSLHSLDRIDNNGNYEPNNVKWSLPYEQANNTRRNHILEYQDKKLSMSQAARMIGISYSKLKKRIYKGRTLQDIVNEFSTTAQAHKIACHQPKH